MGEKGDWDECLYLGASHSNPWRSRGNVEGWETCQQPQEKKDREGRREEREMGETEDKDRNKRETERAHSRKNEGETIKGCVEERQRGGNTDVSVLL